MGLYSILEIVFFPLLIKSKLVKGRPRMGSPIKGCVPSMSLMHSGKLRPTFDYLFGRGIVDLFLGAVGGKHLVKHVWLPLQRTMTKKNVVIIPITLLSTTHPALRSTMKSDNSGHACMHACVCVWKRERLGSSCLLVKHYIKPYCHYNKVSHQNFLYAQWTWFIASTSICVYQAWIAVDILH